MSSPEAPLRLPVPCSSATLRALAYQRSAEFPVLFDSAARGALGHYSLLFAYPGKTLVLRAGGVLELDGRRLAGSDFLGTLDRFWREEGGDQPPLAPSAADLPFGGGWVVYLSYEMAGEVEPRLELPQPPEGILALAMRIPAALIFDHQSGQCTAVAEAGREDLVRALGAAIKGAPAQALSALGSVHSRSLIEEAPGLYLERVRRAKEFIGAGDVYQANLSRPWRATFDGALAMLAPALYEQLRRANPAPFAAWLRTPDLTLLSSSPERLVQVGQGMVRTRPIAGTRPRSQRAGQDAPESAALIAHPKERAEHVMLIDLERNDLGRVCVGGSVTVEEFMVLEHYEHVHHIVSGVAGRLRPGVGPIEVLRAVFPGGTITGCPKFRCMQIIAELEGEARGAYTGSLGYLNHDGSMDFNILIRTLTLQGGTASLRAGAGIVADSDPEHELEETRVKALGLLRALGAGP